MNFEGQEALRRGTAGRFVKTYLLCGTILAAAASPMSASAQDTSGIAEIVVTAQKTEERLSKVPVTISAFTGDQLTDRNYFRLEDFKGSIPGLQVNDYVGETRINIRGLGMNSLSFGVDSQVALSMNGVYIANAFGADQAFLDVARIEVLRGPQGTLYGRNATGGAINIITKRPTETFEGFAQLTYGNYNRVNSVFVASGPLMDDKILGRIAVTTEDHSGYSLNLFDGKKYDDARRRAVRGTLLFNLSEDVTLDVVADY
jgi:iron complex outermembrane receptor protein